MGWESRGSKRYYYRSVRAEGKVRKMYFGSGAAGNFHAILDQRADRLQAPTRAEQARQRHIVRTGDRLWRELWSGLSLVVTASMLLAGFYRHHGQWRPVKRPARTRQKSKSGLLPPEANPWKELARLVRLANSGSAESSNALREFLQDRTEITTRLQTVIQELHRHWLPTGFLTPVDSPQQPTSELENWLGQAIQFATGNRNHAASLIEPDSVTPWTLATRYQRLESADLRVRKAEQLAKQGRLGSEAWLEITCGIRSPNPQRTAG